jgi:hypothetical protein
MTKESTVTIKLRYITPLLAAAGAAAAIVAAPMAMADATTTAATATTAASCTYLNGNLDTQCSSPGNTQINDSLPFVPYTPQYPYWEGGYGHGGGHMGGGHR